MKYVLPTKQFKLRPPCFNQKKKSSWVTAKKISSVHYTSEPKPTDFCSLFLTTLKKKNHILHSSLLIAWPLACGVPKKKKGGKSMHIEEELSTKLFYYVYLCKWHIRLFKKVSVAPPLSALWSAFPPCSMDGWVAADGGTSVIGFTQTCISGECKGGWLFSSDSCQRVKWLKV